MDLEFRTLDGEQDLKRFVEEWQASGDKDATFMVAENTIYLVPYGNYSIDFESAEPSAKFSSPYRSHAHVVWDFGLPRDSLAGGGYLKINEEGTSCRFSNDSRDYGYPQVSVGEIVDLVNAEILDKNKKTKAL